MIDPTRKIEYAPLGGKVKETIFGKRTIFLDKQDKVCL